MDFKRISAVGWVAFFAASAYYLLMPVAVPSPVDWPALAVAVGRWPLRPNDSGLWLFLSHGLSSFYGTGFFLEIIAVLGALAAGVVSAACVTVFGGAIPVRVARILCATRTGRFVHALMLLAATAFVVRSEPVAAVAHHFSPAMLELLLLALAASFTVRYRRNRTNISAYAAALLLGVAAYETPFALVVLPVVVFLPRLGTMIPALRTEEDEQPDSRGSFALGVRWRSTVWFVLGLAVAFAATRAAEALVAGTGVGFDATLADWAGQVVEWASLTGFAFVALFAVVPFVLARWLLPRATDESDFLPYHVGLLFAALGIFAYLQAGPFPAARFWNWGSGVIHSPSLKGAVLLAEVTVFVWLLCVLAIEVVVRRYQAIMAERYQETFESEGGDCRRAGARLSRALLMSVPVVLAFAVPLAGDDAPSRAVGELVDAYADEVVEECGDLAAVFTEGALDPLVELKAAIAGRRLQAVSMMGTSDGYPRRLRLRLAADEETRALLTIGAAAALKTLADRSSVMLTNVAVQVGLEMWKNRPNPVERPVLGGVAARLRTKDAATDAALNVWAREGVARAQALSERFLVCSAAGGKGVDRRLWHALLFAQWRLSRMARLRAIDAAADVTDAEALARSQVDGALADRLEALNPEARKALGADGEWMVRQNGALLQPREWLRIGLAKADFSLAKTYAEIILSSSPEDAEANFAMGMHSLVTRNYPASERFLKKCLAARPTDPAVLNNLANVELELGRLDEALVHAAEAVRLHPEIAGARRTLERAQDAADARADDLKVKGNGR